MIGARELRIGNKLQKDNGEIFTFLRLDNTNDVLVEEQRGLLTLNYNLYGIPITEEWLERLGFEQSVHWFVYTNDSIGLKIRIGNYEDVSVWNYNDGWLQNPFVKLKYVHQLQNFVFSWAGKELEIRPQ